MGRNKEALEGCEFLKTGRFRVPVPENEGFTTKPTGSIT